ncbi:MULTISPECIES: hypothetical protein [Novosphingobium]|uniref:hypothetical protein n=1 Tax=Novosphingobium TaxID=165696 RepID=UPI0022F2784A|nr:hypothetical protein [Novosphingobium resinovorum]GLK46020.1 hypothetical protein GCM10017612_39400 [Novosphingobium resinovorum]
MLRIGSSSFGSSMPRRAGRIIVDVLTDQSGRTGIYFGERDKPVLGSALAHDAAFQFVF